MTQQHWEKSAPFYFQKEPHRWEKISAMGLIGSLKEQL